MKTAREELIEGYKNAADLEAAIIKKVQNEFTNVVYEPLTIYAVGYVIYHVQANLAPSQKETVIDFDMLFKMSNAYYRAKQKWLKDSLGENLGKINDLFFLFPQQACHDFLNNRGKNSAREAIPV